MEKSYVPRCRRKFNKKLKPIIIERLLNPSNEGFCLFENNLTEILFIKRCFWTTTSKKDIKINCYAIDKFFVEVVYDARHDVITEIRSFKYGYYIDQYTSNPL